MAGEKSLPTLPTTPVLDANGYFSRVWAVWFRQAFNRMGGVEAPTNKEIETQNQTLVTNVSSVTTRVTVLENNVSSGASLGVGPVL